MAWSVAGEAAVWVLAVGFWVQGFRYLPSDSLNSLLDDGLGTSRFPQLLLGYLATIPLLGMPAYGILSDSVHVGGAHRMPYLVIGVLLQAISWLLLATLQNASLTFSTLSFLLLLSNLGASISQVMNDAIAAEYGRSQPPCRLESLVLLLDSLGGLLATTISGLSPHATFHLFTLVLTIQFFLAISVSETNLHLPKKPTTLHSSIVRRRRSQFIVSGVDVRPEECSRFLLVRAQLDDLVLALNRPDIFYSICWYTFSYAAVPFTTESTLNFLTVHLKLEARVLRASKVLGHIFVVLYCATYKNWWKTVPPRRVLSALQGATAVLLVSNVLFVKGYHREIGMPDGVYVVVLYGLFLGLIQCRELPFSVLIGQLCPVGCEGGLMASVASAKMVGGMVCSYLGVMVVKLAAAEGERFEIVVLAQALCTFAPLLLTSWIPKDELKEKED